MQFVPRMNASRWFVVIVMGSFSAEAAVNQPNVKSVIPSTWKVPELFRSRLGESAGRQRAMVSDGHLLIVLHEPPMPGDHMRRGRLFWREPDGQWKSNSLGTGIQALKKHLAEYSDAAAQLADRLDLAESADDYFGILQAAAPLSRAARHSHAALQQARELTPYVLTFQFRRCWCRFCNRRPR